MGVRLVLVHFLETHTALHTHASVAHRILLVGLALSRTSIRLDSFPNSVSCSLLPPFPSFNYLGPRCGQRRILFVYLIPGNLN